MAVTFEEMFRSHVERCLQDLWERPDLLTDPDGDYPFRAVTSMCWVRVERDPSAVRVFAYAATGVKRSAKLLTELNELNRSARWVTLHWYAGTVVVERALATTEVDRDSLRFALEAVVSVADEIGPMVAAVHGGGTPLESLPDNEDAA